ncbi:MAG TPA: succinate dehydrogenase/fumarate reductase iron-sulfur subunit [Chthoniobacteraceae bacterium]|nr:succinate dehydrogenase/fumarate reductase iron-sulfur subunit [Chthoniobacteraceae bacterium]
MNLKLKVWRQRDARSDGRLVDYEANNIPEHASFLEMLDIVNEALLAKNEEPIAFDHDCREGICGTCSLTINGIPHGPSATTTCQLYMRSFREGDTIFIEPFRARAFPVVRDLITDRSALDRLQQAAGFITVRTGSAPDGNAIPVPKPAADRAMEAAACIGCGACVAACPNASAMLFAGAKVTHLAELPQGQPERRMRALRMVRSMDAEGFGNCSNYYECEAVCPADIPILVITKLNREFAVAALQNAVA